MAITLLTDREIALQVTFKDANDNNTTTTDPIVWSTSDPALVTLEVQPDDDTIVKVTPVGPTGSVQVTATAGTIMSTVDITLKVTTEPGVATTSAVGLKAMRYPIEVGKAFKMSLTP